MGFTVGETPEKNIKGKAVVLPVGGGEDGIFRSGGGAVSRGNDIGGNPGSLFGGTS